MPPATNHKSRITNHPFSAVIITFNVADTIAACLKPLLEIADEILVLDSFSTDGTAEICRKMGAKVIPQAWLGYAQTKNLGNSLAKNDWILSLDADEVLSDELVFSLKNLRPEAGKVYSLDRLTSFCGRWIYHCGWYPDWKIRLFDRRQVRWQGDFVHESLLVPTDFQKVRLSGKLFHYSYKDREDHLRRLEKYARLAAQEQFEQGKKVTFTKRWLAPSARFFKTYFLKKGFLDGRDGWVISVRGFELVRRRYEILGELWRAKKSV